MFNIGVSLNQQLFCVCYSQRRIRYCSFTCKSFSRHGKTFWDNTVRGAHCCVNIYTFYVTSCMINPVVYLDPIIHRIQINLGTTVTVIAIFFLGWLSVLPLKSGDVGYVSLVHLLSKHLHHSLRSWLSKKTSYVSNWFFVTRKVAADSFGQFTCA